MKEKRKKKPVKDCVSVSQYEIGFDGPDGYAHVCMSERVLKETITEAIEKALRQSFRGR